MAPREITILGGGSWGTALAIVLSTRFERVYLWVHSSGLAQDLQATRENPTYLPGFKLPPNVTVSSQLRICPWVLSVVPSKYLRSVLESIDTAQPFALISATKGIEANSFLRMSEVAVSVLGAKLSGPPAVLSGPTFAREVAAGGPAAIVISSVDESFSGEVQDTFGGANLRLYRNDDVIGVELSAAIKNVIAIAAGAVEGLGLGSNSLAAVITRGLAEIARLVTASGGRSATVSGLAGLGDLVLTCTGNLSRNRSVGIELARGRDLRSILAGMQMVAEGVETTATALSLAASHQVELPIAQAVQSMLGGIPAEFVLRQLLDRSPKAE